MYVRVLAARNFRDIESLFENILVEDLHVGICMCVEGYFYHQVRVLLSPFATYTSIFWSHFWYAYVIKRDKKKKIFMILNNFEQ